MNAVPSASLCRDRLPVRDASAVPAADRAQCPVPLNVGLSRIRSGFDRHRALLKIHPWAADSAAQRAVAGSRGLRRGRQSKADGATVTRTPMHCQNLRFFRMQPAYSKADLRGRQLLAGKCGWPTVPPPPTRHDPSQTFGSANSSPRSGHSTESGSAIGMHSANSAQLSAARLHHARSGFERGL